MSLLRLLIVGLIGALPVRAERRTEIVLDASRSMQEELQGQSRFELARAAVRQVLSFADGAYAIRVYGHRVSDELETESCRDSELVVPFGSHPKTASLDQIVPRGKTSLGYSLNRAAEDLGLTGERQILVLSDGEDTCGADPAKVVEELRGRGFAVKIHIIGLNLNQSAVAALAPVAAVTGGSFTAVQSKVELVQAVATVLDVQDPRAVQEIAGDLGGVKDAGDRIETALLIEAGRFTGSSVGGADRTDYFQIDGKRGEKFLLKLVMTDPAPIKILIRDRTNVIIQERIEGREFESDTLIPSEDQSLSFEIAGPELEVVRYEVELIKQVAFGD